MRALITANISFLIILQSEIQDLGVDSIICCGLFHWFIDSCKVPLPSYPRSVCMPVFNIFRQTSFTLDFHSSTWSHSMLIALVRPKSQIKLHIVTLVARISTNKFCMDTIWSLRIYKCWKFGMVPKNVYAYETRRWGTDVQNTILFILWEWEARTVKLESGESGAECDCLFF